MNLFVISDIHGMYDPFRKLLTYWDRKSKLVLLGDLVDRGPQSYEVIQNIMLLKRVYGDQVIYCKGNHDVMLLDYMYHPEANQKFYYQHGGRETISSFMKHAPEDIKHLNLIEQAYYIKEHFKNIFTFLEKGELYTIIGDVLFTHAGFESYYADIHESAEDDFLWIRDHYLKENKTPFINIFGHTPVKLIHKSDDVWVSTDKKYIGIDGRCVFGGQLNAVLLNDKGEVLDTFSVKN